MNDKKVKCKHIWMPNSWEIGEWGDHEFCLFGTQKLKSVRCQKCLEVKQL
jgi:hypothetical protein